MGVRGVTFFSKVALIGRGTGRSIRKKEAGEKEKPKPERD